MRIMLYGLVGTDTCISLHTRIFFFLFFLYFHFNWIHGCIQIIHGDASTPILKLRSHFSTGTVTMSYKMTLLLCMNRNDSANCYHELKKCFDKNRYFFNNWHIQLNCLQYCLCQLRNKKQTSPNGSKYVRKVLIDLSLSNVKNKTLWHWH